jgi:hypothetical protein
MKKVACFCQNRPTQRVARIYYNKWEWNKYEGDTYTPRNVLMSSIILAPSLVNQKREAIISYCEKRASSISTIEAKKKRGDTELNELNMKPNERDTSHCCNKKEVSCECNSEYSMVREHSRTWAKSLGERLFLRSTYDMRKKNYKEMAHHHLIESLKF